VVDAVSVIADFPPNFDRIDAKFMLRQRGLTPIFAWGNDIYNPYCVQVPRHLMAHEAVHGERQKVIGIDAWWDMYITFDQFRLVEEVVAHRAEMEALLFEHGDNRSNRRTFLSQTAQRLKAPLYMYKLPIDEAKRLLKNYRDEDYAIRQVNGA
jgi:hypothetical protein